MAQAPVTINKDTLTLAELASLRLQALDIACNLAEPGKQRHDLVRLADEMVHVALNHQAYQVHVKEFIERTAAKDKSKKK